MTEIATHAATRYAIVASEYYDRERHPTCADFRWASDRLLGRLMPESPAGLLCDVGAGDSALAAWLLRHGTDLAGICLFDTSSEMLAHSARWVARGATADVACAEALPIADGGADLVVASLADPYDTASSHPSSNDSASKLSELRAAVNHAAGDPRFRRSGRVKLTTALATSVVASGARERPS
jgi:hypothetical protein